MRVRAALMCAFLAAEAPVLLGQPPGPALGALDHAVWTIRDGAPLGVRAFAQSADGVLWLGTTTGLYRFDGVRFEAFEPPASQPLPSLAIARDAAGSIWVAATTAAASIPRCSARAARGTGGSPACASGRKEWERN